MFVNNKKNVDNVRNRHYNVYNKQREVISMSDKKQKIIRKLKTAIPNMDDAEKTVLMATINALSASADYRKRKRSYDCAKNQSNPSAVT